MASSHTNHKPKQDYTDSIFISGCCMPGVWVSDAGYSPFIHNIDTLAVINLNLENLASIQQMLELEEILKSNNDLYSVKVNATRKIATISWSVDFPINIRDFLDALQKKGYKTQPFLPDDNGDVLEKKLMRCLVVAIFGTLNVMMLSISIWTGNVQNMDDTTRTLFHFISAVITVPVAFYASIPFFKGAVYHVSNKQSGMDIPISIAIVLSIALSLVQTFKGAHVAYYDSTLMLLVFLLLGRYLDVKARRKARDSAVRLLSMQSKVVSVYKNGKSYIIPSQDVLIDDIVLVHVGENIPMDGIVTQGTSTVNSSMMTGESLPTVVSVDSNVLAGTVNLTGIIYVKVTALSSKSVLAKMMDILQKTQTYRGTYTRLSDKVAKYYAPVIYISSIGAYFYHTVYNTGSTDSLAIALSVLIIACPCALAIAVPGVQAVCTGTLFSSGVLVKDGSAIERLADVDTFVFDKTGTLTRGFPILQDGTHTKKDLGIASALAKYSNHPVSLSLQSHSTTNMEFKDVQEIAGGGIIATHNNETYRLGNALFVGQTTIPTTQVWLQYPNGDCVCFTFNDPLKHNVKKMCQALHALNIQTYLLSGDVFSEAERVATAVGISNVYGACNPLQKADIIKILQAKGKKICMVGDGINDTPALSLANVAIAPSSGSDIAQQTGDFVLRTEDIYTIIPLLSITRKAQKIIKVNIVFSIAYNILAIPLAFMGYVSPLVAVLSMSFSSLVVVLNALSLRNIKHLKGL